jgi:hypothetical protein
MIASVSPATTLVVVLGASTFPDSELFEGSPAFSNAAGNMLDYFLGGLGIHPDNIATYFDVLLGPNDLELQLSRFLRTRRAEMKAAGAPATDLIIYYVGHGSSDENQNYILALPTTRDNNLGISSFVFSQFATTISEIAQELRTFLIIDACFSGKAAKAFQSFEVQVNTAGPKGIAYFLSSGSKRQSRIREDGKHTVFSHAMLEELWEGGGSDGGMWSLEELSAATWRRIRRDEPKLIDQVQPFATTGQPQDQYLLKLPVFPSNPKAAIERNRQLGVLAEAKKQVEARRQAQQAQAKTIQEDRQKAAEEQAAKVRKRAAEIAAEHARTPEEAIFRPEAEAILNREPSPDLLLQWIKWRALTAEAEMETVRSEWQKKYDDRDFLINQANESYSHANKLELQHPPPRGFIAHHRCEARAFADKADALNPEVKSLKRELERAEERAEFYKNQSNARAVQSLVTELRRARKKGKPLSAADCLATHEQSAIQIGLTQRKIARIFKWFLGCVILVLFMYACATAQKG